jgi:hypothetical protein
VTDETGDALVNMPVRVLKRTLTGGKVTLKEYQSDTTDDRGNYRVGQLEPGDYVVVVPYQAPSGEVMFAAAAEASAVREVMVRAVAVGGGGGGANFISFNGSGDGPSAGVGEDGRPLAFATMFYPNSPVSTRATVITVTSGEERASVDFQVRAVTTSKVSGTATGPDGAVANLQISLVPTEADINATTIETITASATDKANSRSSGVPPQPTFCAPRECQNGDGGPGHDVRVSGGAATSWRNPWRRPQRRLRVSNAVGRNESASATRRRGVAVNLPDRREDDGHRAIHRFGAEADAGHVLEHGGPARTRGSKPGVAAQSGGVDQNGQFSTNGVPPGR